MPTAKLLNSVLRLIRSKRDQFIVVLVVLAVAVGIAIILGPHVNSGYNNIVPNGSE
ncbi:MAG: hypothetical protein QOH92_2271 [Chloroflexota bacterium]|jgi:phosphotransferase system  glucose/maltose/N-acetylglucosamine-specific IIC component|nr:hypothetical protein [Chloroflexota bacterium]